MDERLKVYDEKMKKALDFLASDYATIRAGRANPHVLDKLKVNYYGTPTPIQQVGNITVPEPRMIQIAPWEKSLIKEIEKAIMTSDIGINPSNDGAVIRLVFPELTEERRKDLVKEVKKKGEESKVAVRNIRRDGNDAFKKLAKEDVSEDQIKQLGEELQKMTAWTVKMLENLKVPNHVAIILDGNGRWAKSKGMPRNYGHVQGAKAVEVICEEAYKMGIQYLTVYAFSTENWKRPKDEVDALMKLLRNYLKTCLKTAEKNRMCVRILGDKAGLDNDIRARIEELEKATKNNDGLHFQIALNYGGRDEIVRAVRKAAALAAQGGTNGEEITEEVFGSLLDTGSLPDPDLLIRTCNEQRISNFLLWQLAYTEFYFTEVPWPDFSKEAYNKRDRRYGLVKND